MDSLLIAVVVGLVVWLFMRRMVNQRTRLRAARQQAAAQGSAAPAGESPPDQKTMPRFGVPGSVTRAQLAQLRACHLEPSRQWSREEAQLILNAVAYLRVAITDVTGDDDPPIEVQNDVLGFILTDEALRESVQDWSLNRTREEEDRPGISLPRDETYERVVEFITELWETGARDG